MKLSFLTSLCCIACKGGLQCTSFNDKQPDECGGILDGKLSCGCGAAYPVIAGVPRLLPHDYASSLKTAYEDFFKKYAAHFPHISKSIMPSDDNSYAQKIKREVMKNFGYEWRTFSDYNLNNFDVLFHPQDPSMLNGKVVLDAGCGAGRHTKRSAEAGARIIGMDLSTAVDAAHQNTKSNTDICIVQADICKPPFKEHMFDFVYSFGVLHHLPMPLEGFLSLCSLLKKNGQMMIWVYSSKRKFSRQIIEILRKITTKIPERPLQGLSFACAFLDYGILIYPYKMASRSHALKKFLTPLVPSRVIDYARYDFRVTYVDWFDRLAAPVSHYHSKEELEQWYKKAGFTEFAVSPTEDWGWKGFGKLG